MSFHSKRLKPSQKVVTFGKVISNNEENRKNFIAAIDWRNDNEIGNLIFDKNAPKMRKSREKSNVTTKRVVLSEITKNKTSNRDNQITKNVSKLKKENILDEIDNKFPFHSNIDNSLIDFSDNKEIANIKDSNAKLDLEEKNSVSKQISKDIVKSNTETYEYPDNNSYESINVDLEDKYSILRKTSEGVENTVTDTYEYQDNDPYKLIPLEHNETNKLATSSTLEKKVINNKMESYKKRKITGDQIFYKRRVSLSKPIKYTLDEHTEGELLEEINKSKDRAPNGMMFVPIKSIKSSKATNDELKYLIANNIQRI